MLHSKFECQYAFYDYRSHLIHRISLLQNAVTLIVDNIELKIAPYLVAVSSPLQKHFIFSLIIQKLNQDTYIILPQKRVEYITYKRIQTTGFTMKRAFPNPLRPYPARTSSLTSPTTPSVSPRDRESHAFPFTVHRIGPPPQCNPSLYFAVLSFAAGAHATRPTPRRVHGAGIRNQGWNVNGVVKGVEVEPTPPEIICREFGVRTAAWFMEWLGIWHVRYLGRIWELRNSYTTFVSLINLEQAGLLMALATLLIWCIFLYCVEINLHLFDYNL